jgi:four helix bundle protein
MGSTRTIPKFRDLGLNPAEGHGRRQGRQRAKFFDDARGSAIECAACLEAIRARARRRRRYALARPGEV